MKLNPYFPTLLLSITILGILSILHFKWIDRSNYYRIAQLVLLGSLIYFPITYLLFPKDRYEGNDKFCIFIKDRPAKLNGVLLGNGCVDSFHLNHIMLFAAVGLLVPFTEVLPVILISILFEGAEHISFKYITKDCKDAWCHLKSAGLFPRICSRRQTSDALTNVD